MGYRVTLVCAALAVAACGDDPVPEVGSGDRLKIVRLVFADGTRQPAGTSMFDRARDERCAPERWADGVSRCTPSIGPFLITAPVFADDACADRILDMGQSWDPGPYTADVAVAPRQGIERLRHLDKIMAAQVWLLDENQACVGPYDGTGRTFYRAGAEIPAGDFAVVVEDDVGGFRFQVRAWASDDGLFMPFGLHDGTLGFDCAVAGIGSTTSACLPPVGASLRYTDDACTAAALGLPSALTEVPAFVGSAGSCTPRLFEVGEPLPDTAPMFELQGDGCVAVEPWTDVAWRSFTEVGVTTLERGQVPIGGRRLQQIVLGSGSQRLADWPLFDTMTGEECAPGRDAAGVLRCLPMNVGFVDAYFSDAACTQAQPLINVWTDPPVAPCSQVGAVPRFAIDLDTPDRFVEVGAPYTGPLFRLSEGVCVAGPYDGVRWPPAIFQLGAEHDTSFFVAASEEIDP